MGSATSEAARARALREAIRHGLPRALAAALPHARWFGGKDRSIVGVAVVDLALDEPAGFGFAVVEVGFAAGPADRYVLPLSLAAKEADAASAWVRADAAGEAAPVGDALADPDFPAWLLRLLAGGRLDGERGTFAFETFPLGAPTLARAQAARARVGGAEQSNSSILFGEALVTKLFRRIEPGINPDAEIGRFLAERTPFRAAPWPLAAGFYRQADGSSAEVAFAQAFVPNLGDGWSWILARLADTPLGTADAIDDDALDALGDAAADLGRTTADLHRALAMHADDDAFAPVPIAATDADAWVAATTDRLQAVERALHERADAFGPPLAAAIDRFRRNLPALERQAEGFRRLIGLSKTRVHGDLHLGQTLRTPDDGWILLDFEGEPARPLAERRAKTSPLKDVAGMLRSFSYARGAAAHALGNHDPAGEATAHLARWERRARAAFLDGYRRRLGTEPPHLAPASDEAFARAVAAWELDKALYEIGYELGNRPDWLHLPLGALVGAAP